MVRFVHGKRSIGRCAMAAGFGALVLAPPLATGAEDEDALDAAWQQAIASTPVPAEGGCFTAAYPTLAWNRVECIEAPARAYIPRTGTVGGEQVGNGHDYAASVTGLISSAKGSFPVVTGVTSETDGGANVYSIQLNSNFMNTAVCNGHPSCLSWLQFVYSSSSRAAFMQTWLINWNATCPSGWFTFSNDCYRNSAAVGVPQFAIKKLKKLAMQGSATANGNDVLIFTGPKHAYTTTGSDSVVDLASGWNQSEFNIIGDGGGSQANFNAGSHITVNIAVNNGTTQVPVCAVNAGTTGETNNLNLGSCSGTGGASPFIQFTESN